MAAYTSPSGYNYSSVWPMETDYVKIIYRNKNALWMKTHWYYALYISLVYIIFIFSAQRLMKNREKFELRKYFVVWNFGLAVYSILGTLRTLPEFIYIVTTHPIKYSVCVETFSYGITGYWSWLFCASKIVELIDTIFIILRKQPLIFLHWYHHVTVLAYVWFSMRDFPATGRWFGTINYTIHAFMYTYYTLRTLRWFRIPEVISRVITTAQLFQMIIGTVVNIQAYIYKYRGEQCDVSYENIYVSLIMYATYFYLFLQFFIDRYITKRLVHSNGNSDQKDIKKSQ